MIKIINYFIAKKVRFDHFSLNLQAMLKLWYYIISDYFTNFIYFNQVIIFIQ